MQFTYGLLSVLAQSGTAQEQESVQQVLQAWDKVRDREHRVKCIYHLSTNKLVLTVQRRIWSQWGIPQVLKEVELSPEMGQSMIPGATRTKTVMGMPAIRRSTPIDPSLSGGGVITQRLVAAAPPVRDFRSSPGYHSSAVSEEVSILDNDGATDDEE